LKSYPALPRQDHFQKSLEAVLKAVDQSKADSSVLKQLFKIEQIALGLLKSRYI